MSHKLSQEQYLAGVRRFMEEDIPFNRFLGLRCTRLTPGECVLLLPFRPELVGDPMRPALHGGTISMLADTAGGAAIFSVIEPGDACSTVDLRIDYLRAGALADLSAEASVVRVGRAVGVARIRVWQASSEGNDSDEARAGDEGGRRLVAEGTGVYAIRRGLRSGSGIPGS